MPVKGNPGANPTAEAGGAEAKAPVWWIQMENTSLALLTALANAFIIFWLSQAFKLAPDSSLPWEQNWARIFGGDDRQLILKPGLWVAIGSCDFFFFNHQKLGKWSAKAKPQWLKTLAALSGDLDSSPRSLGESHALVWNPGMTPVSCPLTSTCLMGHLPHSCWMNK